MTLSSKISLQSGQPLSDALLTSCDREQIHRPDAIQPYGLLLIAKADTLQIIVAQAIWKRASIRTGWARAYLIF